MKPTRPSVTAAFVAACRGLSQLLPEDARLVHDPFGVRFGGAPARAVEWLAARTGSLPVALKVLLWIQVRTRILDDVLLGFARGGGRQVVLLGAGFDCRAARFADALAGGMVWEVDHPATQARKRRVLEAAGAEPPSRYVAWDFEGDDMAALPARLAALGHDPARPTLTIWEGVTMYLTEPAIDRTVRAVRAWSCAGSQLAVTYFDRARLETPSAHGRLLRLVVARLGEPWQFGWDPPALPAWAEARGFRVLWDLDDIAMSERLVPRHARRLGEGWRHVALWEAKGWGPLSSFSPHWG